MITKEAIVLAGGLGTRLQELLPDIPKSMALVNGTPFLAYLLDYLEKQSIRKIVLAVGYKYEPIQSFFKDRYKSLAIEYSIEDEPLGTGGGIKKALAYTQQNEVFVVNGDTLFTINLGVISDFYVKKKPDLIIGLKSLKNFERYGTVEIDNNSRVTGFNEQQPPSSGHINGGVYLLNKEWLNHISFPEKFSFEKDLMEKHYLDNSFYGLLFDNFFIDVGVPEDYKKAQDELERLES